MIHRRILLYGAIIVILYVGKNAAKSVQCYSCVQTMAPEVDENVKSTAKKFFAKYYNLPPACTVCNDPTDHEFVTIDKLDCRDSFCTKITVISGDQRFTIRGCKSTLHRDIPLTGSCDPSVSPSICDCDQDLCNGAMSAIVSYLLIVLVTFVVFTVGARVTNDA